MSVVLDASVTLAWIYPDETSEALQRLFMQVIERGAVVPALWRLEVANGLTIAMRRGRISNTIRLAALADLAKLQVAVDEEGDRHAWSSTLGLADRFTLTVYDATYLELAQRRSLPLASLDNALLSAARALGIETAGSE
jgi:predicted nucleic acid-binding protein